jgi:HTH-type transcriptional regulator / antitoxin HipB
MRIKTARELGTLVRQTRRERGLTQAQLAKEAGVSRQWLIEFEHGLDHAGLDHVLRVIAAVGLNLHAIDPRIPGAPVLRRPIDLDQVLASYRRKP